jgi:type IV pilus assembly protein PilC
VEFQCRVASASGQIMETTYIAESEARLRLELEEKGLFLLSVRNRSGVGVGGFKVRMPRRKTIPAREFIVFNTALATLLKAGLPLVQSLDILRKRVPNPTFKMAMDDIYEKVRSGTSLSDAFEAQHLFSGVYTASLMAGEKSGSLESVLRRYVHHMKVLASVRSHVVSALIYPAVLVVLSIAVVALIVFKVVPEFADFYSQFQGAQLPLSTRILVAISTNLVASAGLIFGGLLAAVAGGIFWFRQPGQRKRLHATILRLPYFGLLARKLATAQVSRTLATLLSGGIPLVNSLDIAARSVGNQSIAEGLFVVAKQVREGGSLAGSLTERNMFPHVAVEMVEVGESTGALAEMLNSIADFYDEENETSLQRFSTLIQPVLLVLMGLVIAALLLSLYMPLFQLSGLQQG